jgi:hypothetical protein
MTGRHLNVLHIEDHHIVDVPIVAAGSVMGMKQGPVVAIMHQHAFAGKGKTIRSFSQLEWYKNDFHHKSLKVSGNLQRMQSNDGYLIPFNIKDGLLYVKMRSYTDEEWDTLPHVILTSDVNWDRMAFDVTLDDDADDPRLDSLGGESSTPIESSIGSDDGETKEYLHKPVLHHCNLAGKALVMDSTRDVYRSQVHTVRSIEDDDGETEDNLTSEGLIDRRASCAFSGADPKTTSRHVGDRGIGGPLHHVHEVIADEIIVFYHDALSILWVHHQVWKLLRPLLF